MVHPRLYTRLWCSHLSCYSGSHWRGCLIFLRGMGRSPLHHDDKSSTPQSFQESTVFAVLPCLVDASQPSQPVLLVLRSIAANCMGGGYLDVTPCVSMRVLSIPAKNPGSSRSKFPVRVNVIAPAASPGWVKLPFPSCLRLLPIFFLKR